MHVKGLKSEKVCAKVSDSLPQNILLLFCLKHLVCGQAFTFVTYVRHYATGDIEIYMFIYIIKYILLYHSHGYQL